MASTIRSASCSSAASARNAAASITRVRNGENAARPREPSPSKGSRIVRSTPTSSRSISALGSPFTSRISIGAGTSTVSARSSSTVRRSPSSRATRACGPGRWNGTWNTTSARPRASISSIVFVASFVPSTSRVTRTPLRARAPKLRTETPTSAEVPGPSTLPSGATDSTPRLAGDAMAGPRSSTTTATPSSSSRSSARCRGVASSAASGRASPSAPMASGVGGKKVVRCRSVRKRTSIELWSVPAASSSATSTSSATRSASWSGSSRGSPSVERSASASSGERVDKRRGRAPAVYRRTRSPRAPSSSSRRSRARARMVSFTLSTLSR